MERAVLRRHPERSSPEEWPEILRIGSVAHVAFVEGAQPFVIPFSYHYDDVSPRSIYLHGSTISRAIKQLASGAPVCVTVTLLDALVYSKTALNHSMNYRSVVCFGSGRLVENRELKAAVLERMIRRYYGERIAGRDYEAAPEKILDTTLVVEIAIEEASAKIRRGGANGPGDDDPAVSGTSGVIPMSDAIVR